MNVTRPLTGCAVLAPPLRFLPLPVAAATMSRDSPFLCSAVLAERALHVAGLRAARAEAAPEGSRSLFAQRWRGPNRHDLAPDALGAVHDVIVDSGGVASCWRTVKQSPARRPSLVKPPILGQPGRPGGVCNRNACAVSWRGRAGKV